MTKKKRRRRSGTAPPPPRPAPERQAEPARPAGGILGRILGGASMAPSPFGTARSSLARGLVTIGATPVLLVVPFLIVFLTWVVVLALGLRGTPGPLVHSMGVPPFNLVFDTQAALSIAGLPEGLWVSLGFVLVRSLLMAILAGLIVESLERGGPVSKLGLLRGLRGTPSVLVAGFVGFGVFLTGQFVLPLLGAGIQFLGQILMLAAALFFLGFVPAAAVREGRGPQWTIVRAARAARLPGGRHFMFSLLYVMLMLLVLSFFPFTVPALSGANLITANPTVGAWVYVLVGSFLHLGFFAAYCYRWMLVEADVPVERVAPVRRSRGSRGSHR